MWALFVEPFIFLFVKPFIAYNEKMSHVGHWRKQRKNEIFHHFLKEVQ